MAKKQKFENGNFDFQDELNFPDLGGELGDGFEIKDDRKPVTKVRDGFISGVESTVMSDGFVQKAVKEALPSGYGEGIDLFNASAGTLKDLYNTAGKELKPVVKELKQTTRKILPMTDGFLPKSLQDRIANLVKDEETSRRVSEEDARDASINGNLAEIFKLSQDARTEERKQEDARDKLTQAIEQQRFVSSNKQLDMIRMDVSKLQAYTTTVTSGFQRKSLELQYRQYFLMMDSLEETRKLTKIAEEKLTGIEKNTGLPDFVKMTQGESLKEIMRNRFMGALDEGMFGNRSAFVKTLGAKIVGKVKQKVSDFASTASMGLTGADMALDAAQAAKDSGMGGDSYSEGGEFAGGAVANYARDKLTKYVKPHLEKIKGVARVGNRISTDAKNVAQHINEFADRDEWTEESPMLRMLHKLPGMDLIKDSVREMRGVQTALDTNSIDTLLKPQPYSRKDSTSLSVVIPGYLSRILREVSIFRTGNENIQLTTFDWESGSFSSAENLKKKIFNKIVDGEDKNRVREQLSEFVNGLDKDKTLTDEQREILGQYMFRQNLNTRVMDRKSMTDMFRYNGKAAEHASTYADFFEKYFADDEVGSKERDFSSRAKALGWGVRDGRAKIQDYANAGYTEQLRDIGLIDDNKNVNVRKIEDHYSGAIPDLGEVDKRVSAEEPVLPNKRTADVTNLGQFRGVNYKKDFKQVVSVLKSIESGITNILASRTSADAATAVTDAVESRDVTKLQQPNQFKGDCEELLEVVKANNIKPEMSRVVELLTSVDKRIEDGIKIVSIAGTFKDLGKVLAGGMTQALKFGIEKAKGLKDKMSDFLGLGRAKRLVGNAYKAGKKAVVGTATNIKDKMDGIRDVYVPGELAPRLTAWKMKLGHYQDLSTGTVITSYRDIAGAVVDASTEGRNIVLSADEVKTIFIKRGMVEKTVGNLTKIARKGFKLGAGILSEGLAALPGIYGGAAKFAAKAYVAAKKQLLNWMDGPADVYVKGKEFPVLLAISMRSGYYFSRKSGAPVKKISDIDGPVVNADGEVVLSEDDIAKGLMDKNGRPLRHGLAKITGMVGDVVRKGFKIARGIGKGVMGVLGGGLGILHDFLGGVIGKHGLLFSGSQEMIDELKAIHKLLDVRLPKSKRIEGDSDGDGVREGSVADLRAKKKAKELAKNQTASGDPAKGLMSIAAVKELISKMKGKNDDDDEEDGDTDVSLDLGGDGKKKRGLRQRWKDWRAARNAKKAAKAAEAAKNAGKLSKAGRLGRGVASLGRGALGLAKGVGRVGLGAARVAGSALGLGNGILGTTASVLGRGALMAGSGLLTAGSAVAGTAASVGGAALGAAGTVLGGIASVLASPVVLGALAVAAVGAAGYYGYKYFTRNKLEQLNKLRYVQYGFSPDKNDFASKIWALEDTLKPIIAYGPEGTARLDETKIKDKVAEDLKSCIKDFGVDFSKQEQVASWLQWFEQRFRPVFLTHLTALRKTNPNVQLSDVDGKLKPDEKKKFFDMAKFTEGPYNVRISPFTDLKELPATANTVKSVSDEIGAVIDKEAKAPTSKTAAARAAIAASTVTDSADVARKKAQADKGGKTTLPTGAVVGATAAGAAAAETIKNAKKQQEMTFDSDRGMYYVSGTASPMNQAANGRITALDAVRFKAYGLRAMEADKIKALRKLEAACFKMILWDSKKVAQWKGSVETAANKLGAAFGVDGESNDDTFRWTNWFAQRFLPVYTNYLTAMMANTGKDDPKVSEQTIKPAQQLNVAQAIIATNSTVGGSVWSKTDTPWPGYQLNTQTSTTEANVQGIKDQVKESLVAEEVSKKSGGKDGKSAGGNGAGVSIGDSSPSLWDRARAAVANTAAAVTGVVSQQKAEDVRAFVGGAAMNNVAGGVAGPMSSIPLPKGDGSWAAMKDTITAAAKMVGVDPKLMATMAAIESGFKAGVKAGTSSATGLYQFVTGTWNTMLSRYGSKYGIPANTPPTDPRANALMGAEYIKENARYLSKYKPQLADTDIYMAHFLGAGGAAKFLKADPNSIGAQAMPKEAAANKPIFYNQDGTPRTMAQIYQHMNNLLRTRGKQFGIDSGGGSEAVVQPTAKPTTAVAAAQQPAAQKAQAETKQPATQTPQTTAVKPVATAAGAAAAVKPSNTKELSGLMGGTDTPSAAKAKKAAKVPIGNTAAGIASLDASGLGVGSGYKGSVNDAKKAALSPTTTVTPTAVVAPVEDVVPVDVQTKPNTRDISSGFNPVSPIANKANDLQTQANAQADAMKKSLGGVESLLQKGVTELTEHTSLFKELIKAVKGMSKPGTVQATDMSAGANTPATTATPATKREEKLPTPPVSFSKPT